MALPSSGTIAISQISTELGRSSTATTSLGESASRSLAGVASGAISMSNFYGKSSAFTATISSNQTNLNLRTWALANGWNGSSPATITIGSGVYIYATSIANAGLTIDGVWSGGISVINNGYIIGQGGIGGRGGYEEAGYPAGPALSLGVNVSITNNSYIAGGGGGGAGVTNGGGGGGAGGGTGGTSGVSTAGGAGGGPGSAGANGIASNSSNDNGKGGGAGGGGGGWELVGKTAFGGSGGGGGRILPGSGGAGGVSPEISTKNGGDGASANNTPAGLGSTGGGGGGGGWGATGGSTWSGLKVGGAGGKAVNLNGYTVTWVATGTRWGAIS